MSKTIAIRVADEVYDYIADYQKKHNLEYLSDAFKSLFMFDEDHVFEYNISSKDKLWLQSFIAGFQFVKLAEMELTKRKEVANVAFMLGIVQSIRTKMDMVIDQFMGAREINMDQEQMNRIFDSVNLMICALQNASETTINWNKLQRVIKQSYGFSFEE